MKQKTNALLDVFGHLCILFSKLGCITQSVPVYNCTCRQ